MKIALLVIGMLIGGAVVIAVLQKEDMPASDDSTDWPPEAVAKVENDRAAREEVIKQNPDLFAKVSAAMFRHDLIAINFESNTDEYDPEAGTVIPRLPDCSSSADVAKVLYEEFSDWFGAGTVGKPTQYTALAEEVWELWKTTRS